MQNKGLIRFLAWAFALACLFQLSFTFVTKWQEHKASVAAREFVESEQGQRLVAGNDNAVERVQDSIKGRYLDSIAFEKVYFGMTYRQCQNHELGLGLDLKGGMNVMLEVSTVDVVRAYADHSDDSLFNRAIQNALVSQKTAMNKDFVTLFGEEFKKLSGGNVRLAPYFHNKLADEKIALNSTDEEVLSVLKEKAKGAYESTYQVLTKRIDKFGVAQPNIQKLSASERILVELPGVKEPDRVRKLLQGAARLEFWVTYKNSEFASTLMDVDNYLASVNAGADSAAAEVAHPLLDPKVLQLVQGGESPVVGYAAKTDTAAINAMFSRAFANPSQSKLDKRSVKLLWDAHADSKMSTNGGGEMFALYAIKITTRDAEPLLDGEAVADARMEMSPAGGNEISMNMTDEGARVWKRVTGENVGNFVAIVLDNQVCSAPRVNGEIGGGRSSITGDFTIDEAKDLANILMSGRIDAPAVIVQEAVVGPSLGQKSIRSGLISFILAFIVVLIYMVVFYNRAGWVSVVALLVNVFLLIGALAAIGTVLTLPGIAGIVLTMAMAVDGNVIIYERIKEELRAGSSMVNAVQAGFKNAYSAIIDGQVTTFLLGLVLIIFGSGAVQGFAVTLCVGIVTSLFTSIFITRLIIDASIEKKRKMNFSFSFSENFLRDVHIDFIGKRKTCYIIAIVAVVIGVGSLFVRGLNRGIDFTGGRTYVVRFDQTVNTAEVRKSLEAQFDDAPEVKGYGPSYQVKVTTKYKIAEDGDAVKDEIVGKLYNGCRQFFASEISLDDFKSTENNSDGIIQADQVGGTIAHDNLTRSIWAVLGGLIVMFVYIGLRFRSWRFGLGSVTALAHDTILVLGIFSLFYGILPFNLEVDQYFITAVLTVIGYSINATVVIFDRVREYRKLYPKRDLMSHMNDAINSTLARTVNTSGTTFVTLFMMFCFGGEVIRGFIFALLVGVTVGVFSSLCIACAVVYEISGKEKSVEGKASIEGAKNLK